MTNAKRSIILITILLFDCIIMAIVDGVIEPVYAIKSAIKIVLFVVIPVFYMVLSKDTQFISLLKPKKKRMFLALLLGLAVYAVIVSGYFLLKDVIDFSGVTNSLISGEGVTKDNFIYVAIYISFVNSFCEELLFRGLVFGALNNRLNKSVTYIISSLTFALYHVSIMIGWFSPIIIVLMILALAFAGIIFNRIDDGTQSIYPSWIIHLFANLGINTIGLILFGII